MSIDFFVQDLSVLEDEDDSSAFYLIPTILFCLEKDMASLSVCFLWFNIGIDFLSEEFDETD